MTRLVQWGKQYNDDDDVQFYGVREECILLLSCKHMCLCKECERKLSYCLLCQSSKFLGMDRGLYTTGTNGDQGTTRNNAFSNVPKKNYHSQGIIISSHSLSFLFL